LKQINIRLGLNGIIFDIKKFALFDGPGIRTTVFLKGCPLNCWWCQNPESIRELPEEFPTNGNDLETTVGKKMDVESLVEEIAKDSIFYDESGGGVTFSGGEPLVQSEFLLTILKQCKESEFHTAVDTSGYAPWESLQAIQPFVDLFLYDLKIMDDSVHQKYTNTSNKLIHDNLGKLIKAGSNVVIRIPLITGITDTVDNLSKISDFVNQYPQIRQIDLLPFNQFARSKYHRFNKEARLDQLKMQTQKELDKMAMIFQCKNIDVTIRS
jgi:pyruvate formate lyase activating enzyme